MSSRSDDWPVGWKPTGTPSSAMASQSGSNSGSWMCRPLIGFGLPMTATAPSSFTARRASFTHSPTSWKASWAANFKRSGLYAQKSRVQLLGTGERGSDLRVELIVHEHLAAAGAVDDGHVDALDVHGAHVSLGVVAPIVGDLVVRAALEGPPLEVLAHHGGMGALGHLCDGEVADLDHRLVGRIVGAAQELRRELLERLVEIALPEPVGLHRMQIAVEHAEPVLHDVLLWVGAPPEGSPLPLLSRPACGASPDRSC